MKSQENRLTRGGNPRDAVKCGREREGSLKSYESRRKASVAEDRRRCWKRNDVWDGSQSSVGNRTTVKPKNEMDQDVGLCSKTLQHSGRPIWQSDARNRANLLTYPTRPPRSTTTPRRIASARPTGAIKAAKACFRGSRRRTG